MTYVRLRETCSSDWPGAIRLLLLMFVLVWRRLAPTRSYSVPMPTSTELVGTTLTMPCGRRPKYSPQAELSSRASHPSLKWRRHETFLSKQDAPVEAGESTRAKGARTPSGLRSVSVRRSP